MPYFPSPGIGPSFRSLSFLCVYLCCALACIIPIVADVHSDAHSNPLQASSSTEKVSSAADDTFISILFNTTQNDVASKSGVGNAGELNQAHIETSSSDKAKLYIGKAVLIPIIFFLTLTTSYLPWILKRFHHAIRWMSVGACFTAGIILGAALLNLMPEANEAWAAYEEFKNPLVEGLNEHGHQTHAHPYPYASLIAAAVLLLLICVDFKLVRHGVLDNGDDGNGHSHGSQGHSHLITHLNEAQLNGRRKPVNPEEEAKHCHHVTVHASPEDTNHIPMDRLHKIGPVNNPTKEVPKSNLDAPDSEDITKRGSRAQIAHAWIFFIALSIHSIFDGLSVGAEGDVDGFYALLAAVAGHKVLDGFALGVPIYFANFTPLHTAISIIFCAAMTPLGIGVGMAATGEAGSQSSILARAIILSMSAGSFLFISLIELIPAGFASPTWTNLKLGAILLGWGIMAILANWV